MYKPKLVLFDFGGTLMIDGEFSLHSGMEKLRLAAENPDAATTEAMCGMFREMKNFADKINTNDSNCIMETPLSSIFRNIFACSGLRYAISLTECEILFDRSNSTRTAAPYIAELLTALHDAGIRTGVISNTVLSGEAMAAAVSEHIPNAGMEFIITSADYIFCKPSPYMFLAAAKTAGVEPGECWYCGDGLIPDVGGAHNSGMLPVLYDRKAVIPFECGECGGKEYYIINSWTELIKRLV